MRGDASPPTLFHGGPIRTFDPREPAPESLVIADGRVLATGSRARCREAAGVPAREVDLDGRALLPGFIDPHVHILLTGYALAAADLSQARCIAELVEALREHARRTPDSPVVHGYGYDQSKLAERRHPNRHDLDRVSTTRPVQLQHASGHGYTGNTAALRQSGITAGTPTPVAGRIERDSAGEPLGPLFDSACDLLTGDGGVKVDGHGPNFHLPLSPEQDRSLFALGQESLLRAGVTTVCDAQVTAREMRSYLAARDDGRLHLRVNMLALSSTLDHLAELGLSSTLGDEWLRLLGVKLYADGSVIARTAYLGGSACCGRPDPESSGERDPSGYLYHEPEELQRLIVTAHRLGLRTATHAQGEFPIELVLEAVRQARADRPDRGLVHRIEHCGFPSGPQIARMAGLGLVPVPQPMQVHQYADSLMAQYGEYGARFYPAGEFHRSGLPVIISSDAPVTLPDPITAAWAATTRQTLGGDRASAAQAVDRDVALRGISTAPAALLERADIGHLAPGAAADLVLLDADPTTVVAELLPEVQVQQTWVAGRPVWRR